MVAWERVLKPNWAEVAALGLVLGFGLVMAHGWPSGDWRLGWGAIGAAGTISIGILAVQISRKQQEWMSNERKYRHERIRRTVLRLGIELHNTSAVGHNLLANQHDALFEMLLGNLDDELRALFWLKAEVDLHLLPENHLNAFHTYCSVVSKERGNLGMARLAPEEVRRVTGIGLFERIREASETLVMALEGSTDDLIRRDEASSRTECRHPYP